jgi:hypothetical protein
MSKIKSARLRAGLFAIAATMSVGALSAGAQPQAPQARITEDLRLDAEKEDFPAISRIFVGPRGLIAVLIQQDMQIRFYDANGRRTGTAGRKGSGPGEFRDVYNQSWKADTLVVYDGSQRRMTFLSPDAKLLRTEPFPVLQSFNIVQARYGSVAGAQHFAPLVIQPDGSLLGYMNERVTNPTPAQQAFGGRSHIVRVDGSGQARSILRHPDHTDPRWAMDAFGFGDAIPFTFYPVMVASSNGDRLAHVTSVPTSSAGGTFTISSFRSNGDTMYVRTFPFRGVAVTRAERDSALKQFDKGGEGGTRVSNRFREVASEKMPSIHPGISHIVLGLDNTLWVALRATATGVPLLALNKKGDPIASVLLPKGSRLRQASATQLWTTQRDDDGLVSVVRYKVAGINCGAAGC